MNVKDYKYIFFDWDGCLADSLTVWLNAYKYTFSKYDIELEDKEIGSLFGDWDAPLKYGIEDKEAFFEIFNEKGDELLQEMELHVGAADLLKNLDEEGFTLALLTSARKSSLQPHLQRFDLERYFDLILTSIDVKNHKPDPEIILKALDYFGAETRETIMIGDSDKDIKAAHNAGIDSVLFFPPKHDIFYDLDELKDTRPTYFIEKFEELI